MIEAVLRTAVLGTIERHAMFWPGLKLGVAVSGGADSLFLLHLLHELGPRWDLHLSVVHIDHGLRGAASRSDAEFVQSAAARFNLPFHLHRAQVAEMGGNLEQAARQTRLAFFGDLIDSGTVERIATGHTRSDQAETVLYRLLRGSGLAGLAGILPVTEPGLVRPLLEIDRAQVETWLRERHLDWREDLTNQDLSFARNRLRHQVLPGLRDGFNPQLDEALANLASLAGAEEDYWRQQVPPLASADTIVFHITELSSCHPAIARRRVRRGVEAVRGSVRQLDYAHVERVLEMAHSSLGSGRLQLPGLDIFRSFDWIRVAPAGYDSARVRDYSWLVEVPGSFRLPDGSGIVNFVLSAGAETGDPHDKLGDELDWPRLTSSSEQTAGLLELRNWRPGDRYCPAGQTQPQNIKLLFQEARVPLWERRNWPVLLSANRVVWARRFGPGEDVARPDKNTRGLRIWEYPA